MKTTYLFWDIDGTLLDTARAGIFAWEEAIREVLGDEPDMATMQTAGLTDAEIALRVAAAHGHHDPRRAGDLLHSYAGHLPERLGWRQGRVLPNVRENLEALAQRDDVVNMLLTGNVAAGAQAKLRHYDLWGFFGAGGAFSIEGSDRPSIARHAREVAELLRSYTGHLPDRLGWRQGRVLPNVRENLEALAQRDNVVNMLLTGNVAAGAQAKLRHYGLWDFFGAGGAFSVEGADRPSIARQARELAGEHGGEAPSGEQMVVIGDTPHDISCGKAICARTLAVATGPGYDLDALRACEPWAALPELPPPEELARLVLDRG